MEIKREKQRAGMRMTCYLPFLQRHTQRGEGTDVGRRVRQSDPRGGVFALQVLKNGKCQNVMQKIKNKNVEGGREKGENHVKVSQMAE